MSCCIFISKWFLSSKYEFLYLCLSYKYLFMAYKNPPAAREQVILLKMLNRGSQVCKRRGHYLLSILSFPMQKLIIDTYVHWRFFLVVVVFINGSGQNCQSLSHEYGDGEGPSSYSKLQVSPCPFSSFLTSSFSSLLTSSVHQWLGSRWHLLHESVILPLIDQLGLTFSLTLQNQANVGWGKFFKSRINTKNKPILNNVLYKPIFCNSMNSAYSCCRVFTN